ncbi:MAG: DUF4876 domain-containing protein [Dysgonamonadaceae bacterium]|jgi:hypothetical protein|nr:DUF4876 domain-containing protein [Dysgonamonadaceae bacterium]
MKKYFSILIPAVLLTACEEPEKVAPVTVSVNIQLPEVFDEFKPEQYKVEFVNFNDKSIVVDSAKVGEIVTIKILPGIYTITAKAEKQSGQDEFLYTGSLVNENVILEGSSYTIDLQVVLQSDLIFKELFYAGSRTPSNASYFRDQFYELYNNSESTLYLDGLVFGTLFTNVATANLPTWDLPNAENYVFYQWAWQIPGSGHDYPLLPGESVVLAQWATNHTVAALNPNSINLSTSEFEGFITTNNIITDEPAINLNLIYRTSSFASMPQWLSSVFGCAYAFFFPDETTDLSPNALVTQVGNSTQGLPVPVGKIVDAVELVDNAEKVQLKRVPKILDAGATYVGLNYNGKSVSRKVKETKADGRKIYRDTNNSTDDFEIQDTPAIRRNGAKRPSWSTWGN